MIKKVIKIKNRKSYQRSEQPRQHQTKQIYFNIEILYQN